MMITGSLKKKAIAIARIKDMYFPPSEMYVLLLVENLSDSETVFNITFRRSKYRK
jgi:hypothetical protein